MPRLLALSLVPDEKRGSSKAFKPPQAGGVLGAGDVRIRRTSRVAERRSRAPDGASRWSEFEPRANNLWRWVSMRICFLAPRFPYPAIKGDSLRVYHQLRALSSQHRITLLTTTDTPVSPDEYAHVASMCERVEVVPL